MTTESLIGTRQVITDPTNRSLQTIIEPTDHICDRDVCLCAITLKEYEGQRLPCELSGTKKTAGYLGQSDFIDLPAPISSEGLEDEESQRLRKRLIQRITSEFPGFSLEKKAKTLAMLSSEAPTLLRYIGASAEI